MVKIVISESAETVNDMAFTLRHIADLIEKGNTSGYSPTWAIKGDDGQFTMYIDAVKNEYAISSTSSRWSLGKMNAKKAFSKLSKETRISLIQQRQSPTP